MTSGSREILKRIQKVEETMLVKVGQLYIDPTMVEVVAKDREGNTGIYMKCREHDDFHFSSSADVASVVYAVNRAIVKGSRKSIKKKSRKRSQKRYRRNPRKRSRMAQRMCRK